MNEPVIIGDATLDGFSMYRVREDGEIVSFWGSVPRILKGGTDKDGYRKFVLIDDSGVRRYMRRASMVCTAYHGPRPEGMTVRHRDGTRTNDAKKNLSWATQSVNCQDKVEHGTAQRGSRNGNAVIDERLARSIKAMLHRTTTEISRDLGVRRSIINSIRYDKSWRWLFPADPQPVATQQSMELAP